MKVPLCRIFKSPAFWEFQQRGRFYETVKSPWTKNYYDPKRRNLIAVQFCAPLQGSMKWPKFAKKMKLTILFLGLQLARGFDFPDKSEYFSNIDDVTLFSCLRLFQAAIFSGIFCAWCGTVVQTSPLWMAVRNRSIFISLFFAHSRSLLFNVARSVDCNSMYFCVFIRCWMLHVVHPWRSWA